jgi:hypothetical protein
MLKVTLVLSQHILLTGVFARIVATYITSRARYVNVTLRGVRVTTVAEENNKYYTFWICVLNVRYPACYAHAPHCHMWPARLWNTLPHYLIHGTVFGKKKLLNTKRVLRRIQRDIVIMYIGLHVSCWLFLSDFVESWTFLPDFRKTTLK